MMRIEIETSSGSRWSFPLRSDLVSIGRSQDNDICLPDQWLSRRHAEIHKRDDAYLLVDLKSRNGSFINDKRILDEQRLVPGDVVRLGEHRLRFLEAHSFQAPIELPKTQDVLPSGTRIFTTSDLYSRADSPAPTERGLRSIGHPVGLVAEAASVLLFEHRPLPEIFERILTLLMESVPADRGAILLLEGEPIELVVKASFSRSGEPIRKISRTIARKVIEERVALFQPDLLADVDLRLQESILTTGIRSVLCAPLWFRAPSAEQDAVIGLVYLDTRAEEHPLSESDVPIVSALANIAAAKIENVRLLEESMEKRRLEEDIRVAAEVQRSLLPHKSPHIDGYDLVGSTRPCHAVGGDYYDLLLHEDHLFLALGDVSGKGTSAALLMTVLRAAARAHWREFEPAEAMIRINRTVLENTPPSRFVSFFLAALETRTGTLRYVNAGHPPGLLLRSDGRIERLREGGVVLGLFENAVYETGATVLQSGDTLLLYSDGVTETWNEREEEFDEKGLIAVMRRGADLDATALESEIIRELERFAPDARTTDDRTLLILKRL